MKHTFLIILTTSILGIHSINLQGVASFRPRSYSSPDIQRHFQQNWAGKDADEPSRHARLDKDDQKDDNHDLDFNHDQHHPFFNNAPHDKRDDPQIPAQPDNNFHDPHKKKSGEEQSHWDRMYHFRDYPILGLILLTYDNYPQLTLAALAITAGVAVWNYDKIIELYKKTKERMGNMLLRINTSQNKKKKRINVQVSQSHS